MIPFHRVIEIDSSNRFWGTEGEYGLRSFDYIHEGMILGDYIPQGAKGIAWDDNKDYFIVCYFEGYNFRKDYKLNVRMLDNDGLNNGGSVFKNFEPDKQIKDVEKEPTKEEIERVLNHLIKEKK